MSNIKTRLDKLERQGPKETWRPWHSVEVHHLATPEEKEAAIAQAEAAYPGHRFIIVDTTEVTNV